VEVKAIIVSDDATGANLLSIVLTKLDVLVEGNYQRLVEASNDHRRYEGVVFYNMPHLTREGVIFAQKYFPKAKLVFLASNDGEEFEDINTVQTPYRKDDILMALNSISQ
jgi:hypothetical protein